MRVALGYSRLILRKRNDAIAERFHSSTRLRKTHATLADKRLRDHRRLDNFRPRVRLQFGKPFACRISSSDSAAAIVFMRLGSFLAPLLKSTIWRRMYSAVKPVISADSG